MHDPEVIREKIRASIRMKEAMLDQAAVLGELASVWTRSLRANGKILFFGNGGSAADAQHLACELEGRFYLDRPALPALALTVNTSSLTAIGNDYGYEVVFARQVEAIGRRGDVAVGISTSGNSANVVAALRKARELGLVTMGFTGRGGGKMRDHLDHWFPVDSDDTPRIQEGHTLAGHIICELVEREMFDG